MPFWAARIDTPLPGAAVRGRIQEKVRSRTRRGFWEALEASVDPPPNEPPFTGEVTGNTFRIVPAIAYRNSFLPMIHGVIDEGAQGGTVVRLRMRLHLFTAAFMVFWLGFAGTGVPWRSLLELDGVDLQGGVMLVMLLAGVLLPAFCFFPEAFAAERILRDAVSSDS